MRPKIHALLDLLNFDHMLAAEIESFLVQYASQLKAHLRGHEAEQEQAVAILKGALESRAPAFKEAVADIYEATLDEETVEVVRAFFASEACRRHNEVSPAVVGAIQGWFNERLASVADQTAAVLSDLAADTATGAVPLPTANKTPSA